MVWGANGGIGRGLVEALVGDGWEVVAVTHRHDGLDAPTPHTCAADVDDDFAVQQAVMTAVQSVGTVSLWIYSVGDIMTQKTRDDAAQDWQRILDANLSGAFRATQHSLPLLSDDAHLVYLGAVHERLRLPGLGAYAAAKAGLEAFADALAKEERGKRITVVRPGAVDTPLWDKAGLRLPKNAMTPAALAAKILDAHRAGHKGVLDLA